MSAAEDKAVIPQLIQVDPAQIAESKTNRRRNWGDLKGLAKSIKEQGLIEPLICRALDDESGCAIEVIAGARRLRASKIASQKTVPVIVRDLTDLEALKLQVTENVQREDIHPLEEAEWYEALREKGQSFDDIAKTVGKSLAYVYARAKLLALGKVGRKAFYEGRVSASVALYLARIPHEKLQEQALKYVAKEGEPISARRAQEIIQRRYMLRLVDAPFDRSSVSLVPTAGNCVACPKRTGKQPELFADVESADVCTDPVCYQSKVDAHWAIASKAHQEAGGKVLGEKETKTLFPYRQGNLHSREYIDLKDKPWNVAGGKKSWGALFKAAKVKPEITLVRDGEGQIHELAPAAQANKIQRAARAAEPQIKEQKAAEREDAKRERERQLNAAKEELAIVAIVKAVESRGTSRSEFLVDALRIIVRSLADASLQSLTKLYERRGRKLDKDTDEIAKELGATKLPVLLGMAVELAIAGTFGVERDELLAGAIKTYKVQPAAIAKAAEKRVAAVAWIRSTSRRRSPDSRRASLRFT